MPSEVEYKTKWKIRNYIFDDLPGEHVQAGGAMPGFGSFTFKIESPDQRRAEAAKKNIGYSIWVAYLLCGVAALVIGYTVYDVLLTAFIGLSLGAVGAQVLATLLTIALSGLAGYATMTFWNECVIPFYLTKIAGARLESPEPLPLIPINPRPDATSPSKIPPYPISEFYQGAINTAQMTPDEDDPAKDLTSASM